MNESLLIGIIGGGGAILGVIITQVFEIWKRKIEERKWYLNYLLERKFKSINELHTSLWDCHISLVDWLNKYRYRLGGISETLVKDVKPMIYKANQCIAMAMIYVSEEDIKVLSTQLETISNAITLIGTLMQDSTNKLDLKRQSELIDDTIAKLTKANSDSTSIIRRFLDPIILQNLTGRHSTLG